MDTSVPLSAKAKNAIYAIRLGPWLKKLRTPALAAAAVFGGAVCGILSVSGEPLAVVTGVLVIAIALHRPEYLILMMVAMASTVINQADMPSFNMGFTLTTIELSLILMLGVIGIRWLANPTRDIFVRTPLNVPILLFFFASTASLFNAMVNHGVHRGWLIPQWRVIFCYLVFFAVTSFITTRRQFNVLTGGIIALSAITGLLTMIQVALGQSMRILPYANSGAANVLEQEYADITRVVAPGTSMIFIFFLPLLALYANSAGRKLKRPWLLPVLVLIFLGAIAFSFQRFWWLGTAAALIVLFSLLSARQRGFLVQKLLIIAAAGLLIVVIADATVPKFHSMTSVIFMRGASLFTGEQLIEDSSTQWRLREIESAVDKIIANPIFGVGPGGELREIWWETDTLNRYMHVSYLFVLADVGLAGFLPFLWMLALALWRGFRNWRSLRDPTLRSWVLGLSSGLIALVIAAISSAEFMIVESVTVIGIVMALNEVAIRLDRQECDPAPRGNPASSLSQLRPTKGIGDA